jgi:hypothetical protein
MSQQFPYVPRAWAKPIHKLLASTATTAIILVCGRRVGKTYFLIASLVIGALTRPGRYGFITPQRQTAKAVAWPILRDMLEGLPGVEFKLGDMAVHVPCQAGGTSIISLHSGDDDAGGSNVRGLEFVGLGIDEAAQISHEVLTGAIFPTQANIENPWMLVSGTPRGLDALHTLFLSADEIPGWHAFRIPASESGVYTPERLAEIAKTMPEQQFRREMEADFTVSDDQALIPLEDVLAAQARSVNDLELRGIEHAHARIIGVDVGLRQDESVIARRVGPIAFEPIRITKPSTSELAYRIMAEAKGWDADAIIVDAGAAGQGVLDFLISLGMNPLGIDFGGRATDPESYANRRAEMYDKMRLWCAKSNTVIPPGNYVAQQVSAARFQLNAQNKLQLEKKSEIRRRLGASPDYADALAMTFASHVESPRLNYGLHQERTGRKEDDLIEYGYGGVRYTSHRRVQLHDQRRRADQVFEPYATADWSPYDV